MIKIEGVAELDEDADVAFLNINTDRSNGRNGWIHVRACFFGRTILNQCAAAVYPFPIENCHVSDYVSDVTAGVRFN